MQIILYQVNSILTKGFKTKHANCVRAIVCEFKASHNNAPLPHSLFYATPFCKTNAFKTAKATIYPIPALVKVFAGLKSSIGCNVWIYMYNR